MRLTNTKLPLLHVASTRCDAEINWDSSSDAQKRSFCRTSCEYSRVLCSRCQVHLVAAKGPTHLWPGPWNENAANPPRITPFTRKTYLFSLSLRLLLDKRYASSVITAQVLNIFLDFCWDCFFLLQRVHIVGDKIESEYLQNAFKIGPCVGNASQHRISKSMSNLYCTMSF